MTELQGEVSRLRVYQREWETDNWNCILPSLRQAQQADKTHDREDSLSFLHLVGHSDLRGKGQWWKVPAGCRRPISTLTIPPYMCSNIRVQGCTSRTEQWQWRCWSRLEASLRFSHTEVLTHCALCQNCFQKGKKKTPFWRPDMQRDSLLRETCCFPREQRQVYYQVQHTILSGRCAGMALGSAISVEIAGGEPWSNKEASATGLLETMEVPKADHTQIRASPPEMWWHQ